MKDYLQIFHNGSEYTIYFGEDGEPETVHESRDGFVSYSGSEPFERDKHGWMLNVIQHDVERDPLVDMLRRYEKALHENNYLIAENAKLKHESDKMYRAFVLRQEVKW